MFGILFIALKIIFTFFGGIFTLKKKNHLSLLMALSAGMLVGVSIFDLIPESLEIADDFGHQTVMLMVAAGFLIFHILERAMVLHACRESECEAHVHSHIGRFGALGMSIHGFLDGLAIGVGFSISQGIGFIIALPIIIHSFVDGLNTVVILLKDKKSRKECVNWLGIQAIAPIAGFILAPFFSLTDRALGLMLAFFAGLFVYIGGSDLLPEAHKEKSTYSALVATIAGFLIIFLLVRFLGSH